MPKMEWEEFQRDHHRPHLLVVSVAAMTNLKLPELQGDIERLAVQLGVVGNYAIKAEGVTLYAAFEAHGDADRFAEVFRPAQITRESEWTSKAWARMDGATLERISDILTGVRLMTKRRRFKRR